MKARPAATLACIASLGAAAAAGCSRSEPARVPALADSTAGSIATLVPVSGSTPFTVTCATEGGFEWNAEIEPHMAVNPLNSNHIVVAWQQDAYPNTHGSRGIVTAASFDGGRTWQHSIVPGLSTCSGGEFERATNPWLAFAADGGLYLGSITFTPTLSVTSSTFAVTPAIDSAVAVSRSGDGGLTWSRPYLFRQDIAGGVIRDYRETIAAHHSDPNRAYLMWARSDGRNFTTYFSRSIDHGDTWSAAAPIASTTGLNIPDSEIVSVRYQDLDCLLDFAAIDSNRPVITYTIFGSCDEGNLWTWWVTFSVSRWLTDGGPMSYNRPIHKVTVGKDGDIYAVRPVMESSNLFAGDYSAVFVDHYAADFSSVSSTRIDPDVFRPFLPTIAVAADGTVAVAFYDFRNDELPPLGEADNNRTTPDLLFAWSRDRGTTWRTLRLAGPLTLIGGGDWIGHMTGMAGVESTLPAAGGPPVRQFIGHYIGMVGFEHDFGVAFVAAPPLPVTGSSDIYFARVEARE